MRHLGIVTFTPTLTLAELSVISRRHAGGLQLSLARKFVLRLSFALVPKLSILPLITWDDAVTQYTTSPGGEEHGQGKEGNAHTVLAGGERALVRIGLPDRTSQRPRSPLRSFRRPLPRAVAEAEAGGSVEAGSAEAGVAMMAAARRVVRAAAVARGIPMCPWSGSTRRSGRNGRSSKGNRCQTCCSTGCWL